MVQVKQHKLNETVTALEPASLPRALYPHVAEASPEALVVIDDDSILRFVNPATERLFGYTSSELLGRDVSVLMPEQSRVAQRRDLERFRHATDNSLPLTRARLNALHHSGALFPIEISFSTFFDAGRRYFVGSIHEVSERIRQQAAIVELGLSALRDGDLTVLMNQVVEAVRATLDVDFAAVLEIQADETNLLVRAGTGWPPDTIGHHLVKAGTDSPSGFAFARRTSVIISDARTETRFRMPSIMLQNGIVSGIHVLIQGQQRPYGVLSAHTKAYREFRAEDVHFIHAVANLLALAIERKRADDEKVAILERERQQHESAERLAIERTAVLGQIAEGVVLTDAQGKVTFANDAARRIIGVSSVPGLDQPNADYAQIFALDDTALARDDCFLRRTALLGESFIDVVARLVRPDGSTIIVQGSATPVVDEDGIRLGAALTFRDISAQREFESRKANFIATVSHDLRTPLTVIRGQAQLLRRRIERAATTSVEDATARLATIDATAQYMTDLVNKLIEATRAESGKSLPSSSVLPGQSAVDSITEAEALDLITGKQQPSTAKANEAIALLDTLLETAPIGLAYLDRNLRVVRINEAMAAINGLSVVQTLGRRVDEILPDLAARLRPILCRVLETGEAVVNLEIKGNTPLAPGVERAWLASYYPVRVGRGPVVGVGTVVTEITERNRAQAEAEHLLRQEREARARAESLAAERAAILSHLADGVMIVDADRRIAYLNDAARRLLGDGRLGRYVGDHDDQYRLTGPNGEALARDDLPLAKAVDRGETTIRENLRIERPGLPPVLIELSAAPIVGDRGSRHGAVATFHDVTGQRELDRQRDVFLSSASHDLKTPLTVIQASAELLERRVTKIASPDVRELVPRLQRIRTSSKKMVALLDELLDVSRMRLGRPVDLNRRRTNLKAVLHQVASEYQAATDHHTISVEAPLSEVVGCWDAARLERIFGNLLSNAVKYSPDGGPIRVSVRPSKDNLGYWAVVDVEDHGMGIPADDLPHIFERWQRAGNVPGHIRGTGIGLAIVRFLVTQHGGTVWATSQEGMGSTFTVKLPLQEECGHES